MLAGALETYFAALIVVVASLAIGAGICVAGGARRWTWAAPAVGLAAVTVLAWWAVRLPGEGVTALVAVVVASVIGGLVALRRMDDLGGQLRLAAPAFVLAALAVSIPFAVETHFGILGTGFNVDMSQHLFAADWLRDPAGPAPGLYEQGYPLGPHALAVATGRLPGELATSFSGVTIAAPILLVLTALGACRDMSRWRATVAAVLCGTAYLVATYLAQGSFKELYEATFLIGLVIWLADLSAGSATEGRAWRRGLPPAVLAAGALYAYSTPGLAWLGGTLVVWGGFELWRSRAAARDVLSRGLPAIGAGLVALLLIAAPEAERIVDFGGAVGTVSEKAEADDGSSGSAEAAVAKLRGGPPRDDGPEFDNDLGNLFGQISPLEAFGVWPSGDFRVAPGDGAVPAVAFYAGALLGALALAIGIGSAARRGETALLAALAAAVAIWLAARLGSTPYTTAKALEMIAPVAMLIAARGVLDPGFLGHRGDRSGLLRTAFGVAFVAAAAISSALALGNAPVGPREYTAGVTELGDRFAGRSVQLLAEDGVLADQHGEEFYGWELREARSFEIRPISDPDRSGGFNFTIVVENGHVESVGIR